MVDWNTLIRIRCSSFTVHSLDFKELKGLNESEKQTDFPFKWGEGENEYRPKTLGTKGLFHRESSLSLVKHFLLKLGKAECRHSSLYKLLLILIGADFVPLSFKTSFFISHSC